jgi:hypothetical protein
VRAAGCQAVRPDPVHLRRIGSGMMDRVKDKITYYTKRIASLNPKLSSP